MTKEKRKENQLKIIIALIGVAGTIAAAFIGVFFGRESQNKYVQSQIANVTGDGNTVTMNSVDDLVKSYNKLSEENETLKKQNQQYFEDYQLTKEEKEALNVQLKDTPAIQLKDLGLCIDGDDININRSNSYAIINGAEYFSRDFIDNLTSDKISVTIQDDAMYLGRIVANRAALSSKRVIDLGGCQILDNATDSYGNTHLNVIKLERDSNINYNLGGNYSLLKLKIAIEESSYNDKKCSISILADGQEIQTSPQLNKISTNELEYKDLQINNCTRLEIKCTGDWGIYPLIYDAEVYN